MTQVRQLRKKSFIWLALSCVPPAIGWSVISRERQAYRSIYGMAPEGVAQFGMGALAGLAMLTTLSIAAAYSIQAFRKLERPRAFWRVIEVVLLCSPALVLLGWAFFAIVVLQHETPDVIKVD
jgi:hypothetical protein